MSNAISWLFRLGISIAGYAQVLLYLPLALDVGRYGRTEILDDDAY